MVRNREQAAQASEQTFSNKVGMCQQVTRGWHLGASAGDRDFDGDADAVDGWLSEPKRARHEGDRNPPRGVPLYFKNKSGKGNGHRSESLGGGLTRSTDFSSATKRYTPGTTGTGTIAEVERAMSLVYVGWSETITGAWIPLPPDPVPTRLVNFHRTRPKYELKLLDRAVQNGRTDIRPILTKIDKAVRRLPNDKDVSRVKRFKRAYASDRVLRMGMLHRAVKNGRHGIVEHVYDELRYLIKQLPPE